MPGSAPDGRHPERQRAASRRRSGQLPWENPRAESQWWFAPSRPPRVVDEAPDASAATDQQSPTGGHAVVVDVPLARPSEQGRPQMARGASNGGSPWGEALAQVRRRGLGGMGTRGVIVRWVVRVAVVVVASTVVAVVVRGPGGLTRGGPPGRSVAVVTRSPASGATATSSPTQAELDGVITITNLDPKAPFEGDVHVEARTGGYTCRNAPLPQSTWHVQLDPGATLAVPCEIPVSSPPALAVHTFRRAVPSADGSGLALVDNPAPFMGVTFTPTPAG